MLIQPFENIASERSIVRSGLNDSHRTIDPTKPFSKPARQQLPKRNADTHAGDEVATAPHPTGFRLVVTPLGMVQRQLHEPSKRHRSVRLDFGADFFGEWVRSLRHGGHCD